jgi:hypothetical protein
MACADRIIFPLNSLSFEKMGVGMKFRLTGIIVAMLCAQVQLTAGESFRAGMDVREPKIIKGVPVDFPEEEALNIVIEGHTILKVLIDEQGGSRHSGREIRFCV